MTGKRQKRKEKSEKMYDRDAITLTSDWRNQGLPKPIYEFMEKWEKNAGDAMKTYKFG